MALTEKLVILVTPEQAALIDEARDLAPMSAWVRRAIDAQLEREGFTLGDDDR